MGIIDNFIKETEAPRGDARIANIKSLIIFDYLVCTLWVIVIIIGTIAGHTGDDGTRFGMIIVSLGLMIVTPIIGIIGLLKRKKYKSYIEKGISLRLVNHSFILSLVLTFSPIIVYFINLILEHFFPSMPFSGL